MTPGRDPAGGANRKASKASKAKPKAKAKPKVTKAKTAKPKPTATKPSTSAKASKPKRTSKAAASAGPSAAKPAAVRRTVADKPKAEPKPRPKRGSRAAQSAAPAGPTPFDPNAAPASLGDLDLHLFAEGRHAEMHRQLGCHVRSHAGLDGATFAVWAPNAAQVELVGDMNGWAEPGLPLRALGSSGVHEAFVPGVEPGQRYKLRLHTFDGQSLLKTDPYARVMEGSPNHASVVEGPSQHVWRDDAWLAARSRADPLRSPLHIYEVHLGSWMRLLEDDGRAPSYREIAPLLAAHVKRLGFTHVELMPVMEHPFGGSWGYQVTGYFAVTSRYGSPDELREFVDVLHAEGLGVILDWVPAHFPADPHALARFDGTALYEHEDPRRGRHPDWDTLIFNYGRHEVASFLLSNAVFWLEEFHVDGLRVDAVASMLYLDYSREPGQWLPNEQGGRENLEAVAFLRMLTETVRARLPGALLIAEESTTWPKVTAPVSEGGLGFHFKWNLGWMHDSLDYFATDTLFRSGNHDKLTFSAWYESSEHFLMPLSHDEVVHGKGSLAGRMWGPTVAQRLANLRLLLAWQILRPGKQLLFMGAELGSQREWDHDGSLDWHLQDEHGHAGLDAWLAALGALYQASPCFWRGDPDEHGFAWIDCEDRERSILAWLRRWEQDCCLIVLNLAPVPRPDYRLGVPEGCARVLPLLCSDAAAYDGAGAELDQPLVVEDVACRGWARSVCFELPPLSAVVLRPEA